jgi:dTDP-4-amino-4,6-dideoxygalactose transaminase
VWHQYTVLVTDEARVDRAGPAAAMGERGVGTGGYHPRLVHDHPCYANHPSITRDDTPVAAGVARQCLSLPVHAALRPDDVNRVADVVREILG